MDQRNIQPTGVQPGSQDFVKVAESLGCLAKRVRDAEHLAQVLWQALGRTGQL